MAAAATQQFMAASAAVFFFGTTEEEEEGHILCIYISVTSLCSPPLFNQKTGLLHSLLPCSQNAHSLLILQQYYTENASIRHLTRITPLFKARIFKMDCQFDGNCKKGIHSGFRDRITALTRLREELFLIILYIITLAVID